DSEWTVEVRVWCHDLLKVMRQGFSWTTSNVVPNGGFYRSYYDKRHERLHLGPFVHMRRWSLQEFTDRPELQCSWLADISVFTKSPQALATFCLDALLAPGIQQKIRYCSAWNEDRELVFSYTHRSLPERTPSMNCFVDELHPMYGSWWFWP
ncbi:hypothetical protein B0T25DRAFT_425980, partial [Lasiosphaeria hispida]